MGEGAGAPHAGQRPLDLGQVLDICVIVVPMVRLSAMLNTKCIANGNTQWRYDHQTGSDVLVSWSKKLQVNIGCGSLNLLAAALA